MHSCLYIKTLFLTYTVGQALSHVFRIARRSNYKFLWPNQLMKIFFGPIHRIIQFHQTCLARRRTGSDVARQVQWNKLKLCIWPKKFFINSFNAKIMQLSRQGCINCLNFFWKVLINMSKNTSSNLINNVLCALWLLLQSNLVQKHLKITCIDMGHPVTHLQFTTVH